MPDAILTIRDCPDGSVEMYPQYNENDALHSFEKMREALFEIMARTENLTDDDVNIELINEIHDLAYAVVEQKGVIGNGTYDKRSNAHRTLVLVRKVLDHLLPRSVQDQREPVPISPALRSVVEDVRRDATVQQAMDSDDGQDPVNPAVRNGTDPTVPPVSVVDNLFSIRGLLDGISKQAQSIDEMGNGVSEVVEMADKAVQYVNATIGEVWEERGGHVKS